MTKVTNEHLQTSYFDFKVEMSQTTFMLMD